MPPDAVRVWRGFRLGSVAPQDFLTALGSVFIPVTAQLQSLHGLTAYLPTVMPLDKPSGVPDEVGLVFYRTRQAYDDTELTVPGRACASLHSTVFGVPPSEGSFPSALGESLKFDMPYYLFADQADWMTGFTRVFAAAVPPMTALDFASAFSTSPRICSRTARRASRAPCFTSPRTGFVLGALDEPARVAARQNGGIAQAGRPDPVAAPAGDDAVDEVTKRHAGVAVKGGESFNVRFARGAARKAPAKRAGGRSSVRAGRLVGDLGPRPSFRRAGPRSGRRRESARSVSSRDRWRMPR